jgi:hypothetical protein
MLQEVIDELKDAFEMDLRNMVDPSREDDFKYKYKRFMDKVKEKAELFKQTSSGYRRICCMPSFVFGLVMASRIPGHYTHASWFKLTMLSDMIQVYGTVSKQVESVACHLTRTDTVYLRVCSRERGIS